MDCGGAQDKSAMNVNRVMLRFRPIAPKPTSGGDFPGAGLVDSKNLVGLKGRKKRKYVRVRRNSGYRRSKKELNGGDQEIVTLQLLPGKEDQEWCSSDGTGRRGIEEDPPTWMKCWEADRTVESEMMRVVESMVTVECVTESSTGMGGVGCTDVERDTCPVMVSDGLNRVVWVNGAYRRMVRQENEKDEVRVGLVVKDKAVGSESGFSCRVRVQYKVTLNQWSQMVLPCDVWKINGGGFAWRLDIEAALSLGR